MRKVLVLGKTGMLGHMVANVLGQESRLQVKGTQVGDPAAADYFNAESGVGDLEKLCAQAGGFDYFVNCIGLTKNHVSETDSASVLRALVINAVFPHQLALLAERYHSQVIHMSTDGVFADRGGPYVETQLPNGGDVYGQTKRLGEVQGSPSVLNIRTSIVGPSPYAHGGILEWFLDQPAGGEVKGYTNHVWKGVTTLQFAELCREIIIRDHFALLRRETTVFHFVPNQTVNKYALLKIFKNVFGKDLRIVPAEDDRAGVERTLTTAYPDWATRFGREIPMEKTVQALQQYLQSPHYQTKGG